MIHITDLIIIKLIIRATNGARKEDIISDNCAVTANPSPLKSVAKGIILPTSKITSRAETVETAMIRIFVFFRKALSPYMSTTELVFCIQTKVISEFKSIKTDLFTQNYFKMQF